MRQLRAIIAAAIDIGVIALILGGGFSRASWAEQTAMALGFISLAIGAIVYLESMEEDGRAFLSKVGIERPTWRKWTTWAIDVVLVIACIGFGWLWTACAFLAGSVLSELAIARSLAMTGAR